MKIFEIINKYDNIIDKLRIQSLIQIADNKNILIESCKGIISYDENEIKLKLAICNIEIVGLNLKISNYSKSGVSINGKIHSIKFE